MWNECSFELKTDIRIADKYKIFQPRAGFGDLLTDCFQARFIVLRILIGIALLVCLLFFDLRQFLLHLQVVLLKLVKLLPAYRLRGCGLSPGCRQTESYHQ